MHENIAQTGIMARLDKALRRMPRRQRDIFLAVRLEDADYGDLARKTGFTVAQIEREVAAALLQIDDALRGHRSARRWRRWISRVARKRRL